MKSLCTLLLATLLLASCRSTYISGHSAEPNISMNYNIDVDLDIDKSKVIQATSTTKIYFGIFKKRDKKFSDAFFSRNYIGQAEKMAATYKALEGTSYDIIVNPKYVVEIKRGLFVKKISATVAGYGAKVKIK
jgi:hypothetical protein